LWSSAGEPAASVRQATSTLHRKLPSHSQQCSRVRDFNGKRKRIPYGKRGTAMTVVTTSPQIGSGSTPLPVHDDQPRSSSDHWQVSQYFPLRAVGGAPRWSRASSLSEQPATALDGGRGLEAGKAVGEAPRERLGRTVGASGTSPRLRSPLSDGRAGHDEASAPLLLLSASPGAGVRPTSSTAPATASPTSRSTRRHGRSAAGGSTRRPPRSLQGLRVDAGAGSASTNATLPSATVNFQGRSARARGSVTAAPVARPHPGDGSLARLAGGPPDVAGLTG
jgi:hypothetical protein